VARYLAVVVWCMLSRGEGYRRQEQRPPPSKLQAIRKAAAPYPVPKSAGPAPVPSLLQSLQQALSSDGGIELQDWADPDPS